MTVERIDRCFAKKREQKQTVLVAYVTIGEPSVEESEACALAAVDAGADLLEIGVPFSDPTADGPVIAAASYRAIHRGGSLRSALGVVERIRKVRDVPMVLFSYYNPIFAFGEDRLPARLAEVGGDGLLVVDLPPEEGKDLRDAAQKTGIAMIPLVAPTTGEQRRQRIVQGASGFVYYVSVTGVTGSGSVPLEQAGREARALREHAKVPVVVGFGIDTPGKARTIAEAGVDGVVVGTAIVRAVASGEDAKERCANVTALVSGIRQGLDRPAAG
jgi:tryptophan synthase alpha chain